jgi:colicin import membrane protein
VGTESEDDGFESVISAVTTEKPKAKRKLTPAQLEQLALAREKANAVRKRNAQQRKVQKQKEQKLKDFQHQREQDELDKQLSQFSAPRTAPRKAPTPVAEEESSESSESEEETPPPVKAVKAKSQKSKKKKKKQRPVSESSESSEEEYVPPKKTRVKHQHQPQQHQHQQQQEDLYDHQMRRAFASLFPNSFV